MTEKVHIANDAVATTAPGDGAISTSNGSTAALGIAGVYTGTWEDVSAYDSMTIAVSTDQDGSYSVQFSPDGVNQDSTLTRYYRTARINAPHRFTVTRKYMRVVYTNGAVAQTYLRLQVMLGQKTPLNVPLDGTVSQDYDATIIRPTDFRLEVVAGQRQGHTTWHKWGYNADIDTAASETIWEPGGNPTFLTTASTLTVVSSSASDITSTGIGAQSVVIYGIDANRKAAVEVVQMNGTTNVVTTGTFLGINRVALYLVGTSEVNVGKITVTATTGATVQATIPAASGTTQQAIFFTQAGHKAYVQDLLINAVKPSGQDPVVTILGWVKSFVSGAKYEVFRHNTDTAKETTFQYSPVNPFEVGEKSVLYFTATTDKNDTRVNVRYSLIEKRDADG